ncbi:HEPN domain-containing protein [Candidatus Woesearchaeota archaeon]|nr:HEPN domain-containing protein [Candidatus Woesearchaeota archaeon]
MTEEIKRWVLQAQEDLEVAKFLFDGKKYKQASFFCQQAVEKGLKAVLLKKKRTLIKIHDLVKLAQLVDIDVGYMPDCEKLTVVYVDTRYPDTLNNIYSQKETALDLGRAMRILQWVEKNI